MREENNKEHLGENSSNTVPGKTLKTGMGKVAKARMFNRRTREARRGIKALGISIDHKNP